VKEDPTQTSDNHGGPSREYEPRVTIGLELDCTAREAGQIAAALSAMRSGPAASLGEMLIAITAIAVNNCPYRGEPRLTGAEAAARLYGLVPPQAWDLWLTVDYMHLARGVPDAVAEAGLAADAARGGAIAESRDD